MRHAAAHQSCGAVVGAEQFGNKEHAHRAGDHRPACDRRLAASPPGELVQLLDAARLAALGRRAT